MRRAFTLIELMIVVAIIAVIAAIAIPNLVQARIAANETACVGNMRTWLSGQNVFRRTPYYGTGVGQVYANPTDGNGYTDLYAVGNETLSLVDKAMATASKNAKNPYTVKDKSGYYFDDIVTDSGGTAYDYSYDCGIYAAAASWGRTGRKEFALGVDGTCYEKLATATTAPATQYPVVGSGWMPSGG